MLCLQNVTKTFQLDNQASVTPVQDLSLSISSGELIIVVGRSGTGKSTLLNLTAGLVKPTRGKVLMDHEDLGTMSDQKLSLLRSERMGFIFQFPSLLSSLTVLENVTLPSAFTSREKESPDQRPLELLDMVGLSPKASVYPKQLSAGEQKRVAIARALMNRPEIILADEPTSDLDERTEAQIMKMLREINAAGVTFLIVTHSLGLLPFASRAFEMENGSLKQLTTN